MAQQMDRVIQWVRMKGTEQYCGCESSSSTCTQPFSSECLAVLGWLDGHVAFLLRVLRKKNDKYKGEVEGKRDALLSWFGRRYFILQF